MREIIILVDDRTETEFDNAPEIVRCGDCEWYRIGRQTDYCELAGVDCKPDHFCSWGEKSVLRNQN